MRNDRLTAAVNALLADRDLEPDDVLARRFELSDPELEMVRRGDADELVAAGLDPECVWPSEPKGPEAIRLWLLRNARRLTPAAFAAAAMAASVAAPMASARGRTAPRTVFCSMRAITCRGTKPPVNDVTYTKQELANACKDGGYAFAEFENQGQCVSFVELNYPDGLTIPGTGSTN